MPGPAGEFVGTIAVSVALAIASSFALGLTIVPALTAWLGSRPTRSLRMLEEGMGWDRLSGWTARLLGAGLRAPLVLVLLALMLPAMGFAGAGALVEQFFPPSQRDQFQVEVRLDPQASIEATRAVTEAARKVLLADESVEAVHWFLGRSAPKVYYNQLESEKGVPSYASGIVQGAHLQTMSLRSYRDGAISGLGHHKATGLHGHDQIGADRRPSSGIALQRETFSCKDPPHVASCCRRLLDVGQRGHGQRTA